MACWTKILVVMLVLLTAKSRPIAAQIEDANSLIVGGTNIVIARDESGSMKNSDAEARERNACQRALLYQAWNDQSVGVGINLFTDEAYDQAGRIRPVEPLPADIQKLDELMKEFEPAISKGGTDIALALAKSRQMLVQARVSTQPRQEVMVLMSDGDTTRLEALIKQHPGKSSRVLVEEFLATAHGKRVADEVEKLREEGILLFTIPITPLVYDPAAGSTAERQTWTLANSLMAHIAERANGRSFVRQPGRFEFQQIYNAIRARISSPVELSTTEGGEASVTRWHASVMVFAHELESVQLPGRSPLPYAANGAFEIPKSHVSGLWRDLGGGLKMGVFHRPSPQVIAATPGLWEGQWKIGIAKDHRRSLSVIGFADLRLQ